MTKINAEVVADSICNGHRITTMKVVMPRIVLAEAKTHRVMKRTDGGIEIWDIPGIGFNDDDMLSRNSASSRAIPFKKMVEAVKNDPFIPIAWQKDHSGMQGSIYLDELGSQFSKEIWLSARDAAVLAAESLSRQEATKQLCNRLLEPFMWHTVLVTATEYENFFHLRCPQYQIYNIPEFVNSTFRSRKDFCNALLKGEYQHAYEASQCFTDLDWLQHNKGQAEIHMMALAEAMWDARNESKPEELQPGEWHIPFKVQFTQRPELVKVLKPIVDELLGDIMGVPGLPLEVPLSTAIAAQTSYTLVGEDGKLVGGDVLFDIHNSLLMRPYTNRKGVVFGPDDPKHMSPAEHCAQAMTIEEIAGHVKGVVRAFTENNGDVGIHERYIFNHDRGMFPDTEAHGWCHNYRGWKSYRSMIPNENRR